MIATAVTEGLYKVCEYQRTSQTLALSTYYSFFNIWFFSKH